MGTITTKKKSSSAETAATIQRLLQEEEGSGGQNVRADAARLDELRRVLAGGAAGGRRRYRHPPPPRSNKGGPHFCGRAKPRWCVSSVGAFLPAAATAGPQSLSAGRTLIGVLAGSPGVPSHNGRYRLLDCRILTQLVRAIAVTDTAAPALTEDKRWRQLLGAEFLGPYRDVQYYGMMAVATVAHELYQQRTQQQPDSSNNNNDPQHQSADRLAELLQMIPLAASQSELDQNSSGTTTTGNAGYLFPPPTDAVPDEESEEDEEDDSEEGDDDEELDSSEEDSSDDDKEEDTTRPSKRTKVEQPSQTTNKKKKRFAFQSIRHHRSAWTKAWLAVLRLPDLSELAMKRILRFLPTSVLPVATPSPLRFADFFMGAYSGSTSTGSTSNSSSTVIPMLALEGLFLLMTQHGLEYPDFYKQLYQLVLSPGLWYVQHRTRFCRLLDQCLSRNDMLPAHVVAAFVKRLVRSSLSAPPASILFVLALVSNLLRKHPETSCLVHRLSSTTGGERRASKNAADTNGSDDSDDDEGGLFPDGFDADTTDPEQANALQSSLWELGALERHYDPAVVTLAQSIGREDELQTPQHKLDDFLGLSYSSLFEQERQKRKRRNAKTPLTFQQPGSLFVQDDVFAGILAIPK